jgi:hypothetical protein
VTAISSRELLVHGIRPVIPGKQTVSIHLLSDLVGTGDGCLAVYELMM